MKKLFTILLLLTCFTSCKILKHSASKTNATNTVASSDSGSVKKSNATATSENEWTKLILQYGLQNQPQKQVRDSNVTNNYFTLPNGQTQQQPQVIIYETGKGKQAASANTYDSSWDKKFNQLQTLISEVAKQNKTSVLSFGQIIGLVAGGVLVLFVLLIIYHKISVTSIIKKVLPWKS